MFNLDLLFITSIIGTAVQAIKEACTPTIPAENFANKDLYYNDIISGVPVEKCIKNLENGKYKINDFYEEPHRDPVSGHIIIENELLYYEDVDKYGAYKAQQWVNQGKYNLTPEELKKEINRVKLKYENIGKL